MKAAIQNLLQLQTIDRKLDTLERAKGDLPQKVQQVKSELEKARETLQNNESSLTELQKELRRVELEISTLNTKKKKSEEQLYAVQTNKEYDAVTLEIEQAIEKIDAMENSEIELLDKEKDASEQVKLAKEALAKMEDDFQKTSVKLAKTIEANADKEKSLTEERKSIANKIMNTRQEFDNITLSCGVARAKIP